MKLFSLLHNESNVTYYYFYRPQTKFAKVMFLHLSVSHSVPGGGLLPGGCLLRGGVSPPGEVPSLGGGGCLLPGGCLVETPPPRWLLLQAVCILLECILVFSGGHMSFYGATDTCFGLPLMSPLSGGSRISLRRGTNSPGGCQQTMLPNFPKNCMKLKEFGPPGGHTSLTSPLGPPLPLGFKARLGTFIHTWQRHM